MVNKYLIFGHDMGALNGKTTGNTPNPVRSGTIEILPEIRVIHKDISFWFDIMYANVMTLINGIDGTIK